MDLAVRPLEGASAADAAPRASVPAARAAGPSAFSVPSPAPAQPRQADAVPAAFRQFEAMVLGQFVEAMLPKEADAAFGAGLAGDMWRGLAAEKIAAEIAERGGVGIAGQLLGEHYPDPAAR